MNHQQVIAFIGCGNMAASIIQGLIATGYPKEKLCATVRSEERAIELQGLLGIRVSTDNSNIVREADVVVLAVKPQQMQLVAQEIATIVQERNPFIISVAVGVSVELLENWLGGSLAIVRSMPNTPALIGAGASGLYPNALVSESQKAVAESIHRSVGLTVWLEKEEQINAVASLSGSGPAYFFYIIEAMEQAGVKLGLEQEVSRLLALQTAMGASRLALESEDDVAILRRKVTSPKGTTEQAIKVFEEANLSGIFEEAMRASSKRAEELTQLLKGEK
jgi:pyrroline-5-carboxylate reductase